MEIYGYNFQSFHKCFLCGSPVRRSDDASRSAEALSDTLTMLPEVRKPCQTLGRCFPKRGSPVGHSDDASWSAEALSDARTMLPGARKPCRTLGRCFPERRSPVGRSDDAS